MTFVTKSPIQMTPPVDKPTSLWHDLTVFVMTKPRANIFCSKASYKVLLLWKNNHHFTLSPTVGEFRPLSPISQNALKNLINVFSLIIGANVWERGCYIFRSLLFSTTKKQSTFCSHPKSYFCCDLKPQAKFHSPTITSSGRKVSEAERKKERENPVLEQCKALK